MSPTSIPLHSLRRRKKRKVIHSLGCALTCALATLTPLKVPMAQTTSGPLLDFIPEQGSPYYINFAASGERVDNLRGGLATGHDYNLLLQGGFAVNTTELGLPRGGRIRLTAIHTNGGLSSERLIGDTQIASNIEAPDASRLYDIWFRQDFSQLPLRLRLGVIDFNEYFNVTNSASTLINSSFGIGAALSSNAPFSIYPEPGFGAMLRYGDAESHVQAGIFSGKPQEHARFDGQGQLSVIEWRGKASDNLTLDAGVWHCNCAATPDADVFSSNRGLYGSLEQQLDRSNAEPITLFFRTGVSDGSTTTVPWSFATGFSLPAPFIGRPDDIFSAGVTQANFHGDTAETSYEVTYVWQADSAIGIQSDFQYIDSPSGILADAWVFILRLNVFYDKHY